MNTNAETLNDFLDRLEDIEALVNGIVAYREKIETHVRELQEVGDFVDLEEPNAEALYYGLGNVLARLERAKDLMVECSCIAF
jgi:hypothetical protein